MVIGAGLVGLLMAREAQTRGLAVTVIDRGRAGDGASRASLNVLHGGLRSLQSLDVRAWRRSRRAQAWWRGEHSAHTRTLTCTMPLYRRSSRPPALLRAAFAVEGLLEQLSGAGDSGGRLVSRGQVLRHWDVPADGLLGAAEWDEVGLHGPIHLITGLVADIRASGGAVREETEAASLIDHNGRVAGVLLGDDQAIACGSVAFCVGGVARPLAAALDPSADVPGSRTVAWNVLFDQPMPSDRMLAVSAPPGRGRSLFLRGEAGRTLAGTAYARCHEGEPPLAADLARFEAEVRRAWPALGDAVVLEVRHGHLPDDGAPGTLRTRDRVIDHGLAGGTSGVWTLSGTKLTTAPLLVRDAALAMWGAA